MAGRKKSPSKKTLRRKKPVKRSAPKKNTARRKIDPATGIEISRRQFEKKYGRTKRAPNAAASYRHKFKLYIGVRDDYIEAQKAKGKKLTKREAMESAGLKKIVRDLRSRDPIRKAAALARTGRITPDQIELYAQKFADDE